MFEKTLYVNKKAFKLNPYSEKRLAALEEVNAEIRKWAADNPEQRFSEIPAEKKADWWYRKAQVLWSAESFPEKKFFADPDFESGLLQDSENFFVSQRLYL